MFNLLIRTEINGRFHLLFFSLSLQVILIILTTTDPSLLALSSASYCMERRMYGIVSQHLANRNLISATGFTPGKSTITALLSTFHDILLFLEYGTDVCLTFFDLVEN